MARILVIDDNVDLLEMLRLILSRGGEHEVVLCADGEEGLQIALENPPDLAIVDVMMPNINGYEVVKRLRSNKRTADIHIIILTARGQPVDAMAAKQAGADIHLSKPVDAKILQENIEKLISGEGGGRTLPLAVFSLRGGIGTTTLAVNLALLLQQRDPTVLVDMSHSSGHCALYLGMKPSRHWGPLVNHKIAPGESAKLRALCLEHASGLRLMPAPITPLQEKQLGTIEVEGILKALQEKARFVVMDLPSNLGPATMTALDRAWRIVLIGADDPPGLQTTLRTLYLLQPFRKKTRLMINSVMPGPHPPAEALRRALRVPIADQISYDATQTTAKHRGTPTAISKPDSPLVKALRQLLERELS
ncbi:MAG: response regulator [Anaerolineae bacterium]